MTVVIGFIASENIIFASDGYALYQDDLSSPTYKLDTYKKISFLENGRFLVGSAGSHSIKFEICNYVQNKKIDRLSESDFLEQFGHEIKALNDNNEGKRTSFIIGYIANESPRLFLFQHDGSYSNQSDIVALGSGADIALEYLSLAYNHEWQIDEAVEHVINAIFESSRIPTVNCLPMIAILSKEGIVDLSCETISMFQKFKNDLKQNLIEYVRAPRWEINSE